MFQRGERVRVQGGQWDGLCGVVLGYKGNNVVINIDIEEWDYFFVLVTQSRFLTSDIDLQHGDQVLVCDASIMREKPFTIVSCTEEKCWISDYNAYFSRYGIRRVPSKPHSREVARKIRQEKRPMSEFLPYVKSLGLNKRPVPSSEASQAKRRRQSNTDKTPSVTSTHAVNIATSSSNHVSTNHVSHDSSFARPVATATLPPPPTIAPLTTDQNLNSALRVASDVSRNSSMFAAASVSTADSSFARPVATSSTAALPPPPTIAPLTTDQNPISAPRITSGQLLHEEMSFIHRQITLIHQRLVMVENTVRRNHSVDVQQQKMNALETKYTDLQNKYQALYTAFTTFQQKQEKCWSVLFSNTQQNSSYMDW